MQQGNRVIQQALTTNVFRGLLLPLVSRSLNLTLTISKLVGLHLFVNRQKLRKSEIKNIKYQKIFCCFRLLD